MTPTPSDDRSPPSSSITRRRFTWTLAAAGMLAAGSGPLFAEESDLEKKGPAKDGAKGDGEWKSMFDGKTLGGWKSTNFGGEGEVEVAEGTIVLPAGNDMTGVTWTKEFPKMGYEIALSAIRTDGIDFFCGLTFPVGDDFLTLIVGGWAGAIVGLSNIDDENASSNETTKQRTLKDKVWYAIRLRVVKERIQAWIGDDQVVDYDVRGKRLTIRGEVENSKPLGIATWRTAGKLKDIRWRTAAAAVD